MTRLAGMTCALTAAALCLGLATHAIAQTGNQKYAVVINHEEQYSLWPADLAVERSWKPVGVTCTKKKCLQWIEEVWTDMRPLAIRRRIDANLHRAEKIWAGN